MRSIGLLQQPLRAKVRCGEYPKVNDPETVIWRACQRSITAVDGLGALLVAKGPRPPAPVYIVDGTREILTSVVLRSQGWDR
jgi:hypothetical protein